MGWWNIRFLNKRLAGGHGPCGMRSLNGGSGATHHHHHTHAADARMQHAAVDSKQHAAHASSVAAAHPPPPMPKVCATAEYQKCCKPQHVAAAVHGTASLTIGPHAAGAAAAAAAPTMSPFAVSAAAASSPTAAAAAAAAAAPASWAPGSAPASPVHSGGGLPAAAAAAHVDFAVLALNSAHTTLAASPAGLRSAAAAAASAFAHHEQQQQQQQPQPPLHMPWPVQPLPMAGFAHTANRGVPQHLPITTAAAYAAASVTAGGAAGAFAGLMGLAGASSAAAAAAKPLQIKYVPYSVGAAAGQSSGSSAGRTASAMAARHTPRGLSVAGEQLGATLALGSRAYSTFYGVAPSASSSSASSSSSSNSHAAAAAAQAAAITAEAQSSSQQQSSGRNGRNHQHSQHQHQQQQQTGTSPHGRSAARPFGLPAAAGFATGAAALALNAATAHAAPSAGPTAMETDSVGSRSSGGSPPHSPSSSSASDTDSSASSSPRLGGVGAAVLRQQTNPTNAGAAMIPHPAKARKGGEDAVFVSSTGRMPMVLAVADGVGGWADLGVDPGLFSRALLAGVEHKLNTTFGHSAAVAAAAAAAQAGPSGTSAEPVAVSQDALAALPLELMQFGYDHVRATKLPGSCTACVVAVHNGQLTARNLGDSGFLVLRPSTSTAAGAAANGAAGSSANANGADPLRVIMRSDEQQHSFNFPKQLGCAEGKAEEPEEADAYSLAVKAGDMIVVGTDGLFDNLSDAAIVAHITRYLATLAVPSPGGTAAPAAALTPIADTKEVAKLLALEAHRVAGSKERTPFADAARRHGHHYVGGKMDDISVVVGVV